MKKIELGKSGLEVPAIALGCMSMNKRTKAEAEKVISNAIENGVNFFDHADIYGKGVSEEIFAHAFPSEVRREDIIIQSKTGIRDGYYDFSKEHIITSAEDSLRRLKTDYLDVFLLHRPDALMEPEEVAEAFSELHKSGKVRHFGVSNHNSMQIELLQKYMKQDIVTNQLQLSVTDSGMMNQGLYVNTLYEQASDRDGSILDYSRLNDITIQAWSPFRHGFFEGLFVDNEDYPALNTELQQLADKYNVNKSAIAVAWILRHPAKIQTIIGTMTPSRLTNIVEASNVELTRQEWYKLWQTAGNKLL
ncbi:aryl-alcohol dehydrogenase [Oceanobacillus iheyensis HTE831]|uniref:Aryl-alcohol dehydrogenase n=1 Tax=Oceanobacillus iheyensis (strain DSM 14371 / CIP 107618 / JCM 11309 / KCTC 3954 / HTE831) TaxID=221109 RepID=Q8EN53_OCEIH|nr:aldo/keto reductase [Oceanobacillus iheyensis]BAC14591.1 aryl-alcohol dehydrogenase [Oceanobacillus iheyensis HTE831]